ncbi:TonB-dependent receptor [Rhizosaccharibacter radicis]|uniref:TonB-dependent receptor plug domain-containing protein n=1 Tax=Rhizosaccharibacter radicis TaxID=2782605 RepID=A0ABT1W1C5_9PROT|nr:TonB-dependent receptor plug domain-containing protein [Acetobacteraceae bacterium KSS12]
MTRPYRLASISLAALSLAAAPRPSRAQAYPGSGVPAPPASEDITVHGDAPYASLAQFYTPNADLGPLGSGAILTTPMSVTVLPQDLLVNKQLRTLNDALRDLPSVEVRDQQGLEVSRPQSLGFQGTITQNTRLDGLNIIGTTAIPLENLDSVQVLNGLAGALFGPETPAGVFDYRLKRPTDTPLARVVGSYASDGLFTSEADLGGRAGDHGWLGYRIDLVHGEGKSWVGGSYANRTLGSADLDIHLDADTVIQVDGSHYEDSGYGLPGSIVYDGASTSSTNRSTLLPRAPDPTTRGLGQSGAGTDLITDTGLVKIIHDFGPDWRLELGGLYQDAQRNLFGITNTLTDDRGNATVTRNFTAVPHFTDGSNMASLNGHVRILGLRNDVSLGTSGVINDQYSYRNSIAVTLGKSNLRSPARFGYAKLPDPGGQYLSGDLFQQSIIEGDTLHLDRHWAIQSVFSESFLRSESFNNRDLRTSRFATDGALSPTVSLIWTPTGTVTGYFTYASSVEQSDQAPATARNANSFLSPYHDEMYQLGVKYAPMANLLLTLDAFRMDRPYATTPADNLFRVIGQQRDQGVEFFAQGALLPSLSVLGGVTYIDARLLDSGNPATDGGQIVGVPQIKSDVTLDWHPAFLHGVAFTATAHYESERAATDTNNSFAPQYATLDLGMRYATQVFRHGLIARLGAINLTDKHYYSSIADGNIVGSPGADTAYLAAPRTVLASLEFDL